MLELAVPGAGEREGVEIGWRKAGLERYSGESFLRRDRYGRIDIFAPLASIRGRVCL